MPSDLGQHGVKTKQFTRGMGLAARTEQLFEGMPTSLYTTTSRKKPPRARRAGEAQQRRADATAAPAPQVSEQASKLAALLEEPDEDGGSGAGAGARTSYRQSTSTYDDVRSSHRQRQSAKAAKRRARRQERRTRRDRISSAFGALPLEVGRIVDDRKAYSRADYSRSRNPQSSPGEAGPAAECVPLQHEDFQEHREHKEAVVDDGENGGGEGEDVLAPLPTVGGNAQGGGGDGAFADAKRKTSLAISERRKSRLAASV